MYQSFLPSHIGLIVLVVFATEYLIELVKDSDISKNLIHSQIIPLYNRKPTWYTYTMMKWITCGQCMSVIYSIPGALILSPNIFFPIYLLAIARTTNWLNSLYKLLYRGRITTIEFISPFVEIAPMAYDPTSLLSESRAREFRRGSEEKVVVRTISDIKRVIKTLQDKKPDGGNIVDAEVGGKVFRINTSTNHPPYMQIIADALQESEEEELPSIEINEGEEIIPVGIGSNHSIDRFIKQCTGGERDGNRIKWSLSEGDYFYDPIEKQLTFSRKNEEL